MANQQLPVLLVLECELQTALFGAVSCATDATDYTPAPTNRNPSPHPTIDLHNPPTLPINQPTQTTRPLRPQHSQAYRLNLTTAALPRPASTLSAHVMRMNCSGQRSGRMHSCDAKAGCA